MSIRTAPVNVEIAILLRVLNGDSGGAGSGIDERNWNRFVRACNYHNVTNYVFWRLRETRGTLPGDLWVLLQRKFYEISARNYRLASQLVEITTILEQERIPVLTYKGPSVAMVAYGDLSLRHYQDLDLVVRTEHVHPAVTVLNRVGFQTWERNVLSHPSDYHEVTLAAPDQSYFVDLHWQLAPKQAQDFRLSAERIWDHPQAVQLPFGKVLTLCREDLFLALSCHGTVHRWARLKWLLDVVEILRRPDLLDWERIDRMTFGKPLAKASAASAILLADEIFGVPIPDAAPAVLPLTERVRKVCFGIRKEVFTRGHTTGNNHTDLLRLEGKILPWLNYLCLVYPSWFFEHAVLRIHAKDRALVSLPKRLEFLYYIIRPARLVVKYAVRVARSALTIRTAKELEYGN